MVFQSIYIIIRYGGQITSKQLGEELGLKRPTSKTPWRMRKLILEGMGLPSNYYRAKYGPLNWYEKNGLKTPNKKGRRYKGLGSTPIRPDVIYHPSDSTVRAKNISL